MRGLHEIQQANEDSVEKTIRNLREKVARLENADHVYGFVAWLTGRDEAVTFGSSHECGHIANLVAEYCRANGLGTSDGYPDTFRVPKPEPEPKPESEPFIWTTACVGFEIREDVRIPYVFIEASEDDNENYSLALTHVIENLTLFVDGIKDEDKYGDPFTLDNTSGNVLLIIFNYWEFDEDDVAEILNKCAEWLGK